MALGGCMASKHLAAGLSPAGRTRGILGSGRHQRSGGTTGRRSGISDEHSGGMHEMNSSLTLSSNSL
jgi:hypothetical protein